MKKHYFNSIMNFVVMTTIIMAAITISPSHATTTNKNLPSNLAASFSSFFDPSYLSNLLSDVESVRLLRTCGQYIGHLKHNFLPVTSSFSSSSSSSSSPESFHLDYIRDAAEDILQLYKSSTRHSRGFQHPTFPDKNTYDSNFLLNNNNNNNNNNFPIFSSKQKSYHLSLNLEEKALAIMKQICLKYALGKLFKNQQRDEYLASKKVLKYSNDVTERWLSLRRFQKLNSLRQIILAAAKSQRLPIFSPYLGEKSAERGDFITTAGAQIQNNANGVDDDEEEDERRREFHQPPTLTVVGKRVFPAFVNLALRDQKKRTHPHSFNIAFRTISDGIQRERTQQRRENLTRMRNHMYAQG